MTKSDGDRLRAIELELREMKSAYDPQGTTALALDQVGRALYCAIGGVVPDVRLPAGLRFETQHEAWRRSVLDASRL